MDAPLGVIVAFIALLAVGLLGLLACLFLERDRLRRWVEHIRSVNDDGGDQK